MDRPEYKTIQDGLVIIAGMVRELDLAEFIREINHAEAVGPILDPTLYRAASSRLHQVRELAEAALALKRVVERQVAEQAARR